MKKERSCGIVPLRKEGDEIKVLLIVHKGGKHWGFPKGHQDPGETDLETAKRELREETGLMVVECLHDKPYQEVYTFYKYRQKVCKVVSYFPAFVDGTLLLQAEEITDASWLPIKEASKHLTFKEAKEICLKVIELLEDKGLL